MALPPNYPTVDIICQFCSKTAQVKSLRLKTSDGKLPNKITAAAWKPQRERMRAGIFQPLFIVTFYQKRVQQIYYLSPQIQKRYQRVIFKKRKPLPAHNVRAGFRGFYYDFSHLPKKFLQVLWSR